MSLSAEQIAEKYYHDVYKFCCSRCRNADAAQDITQETFLFLSKQNRRADGEQYPFMAFLCCKQQAL